MSDAVTRDKFDGTVEKIDTRLKRLEVLTAVICALSVWQLFGPAAPVKPSDVVPTATAIVQHIL